MSSVNGQAPVTSIGQGPNGYYVGVKLDGKEAQIPCSNEEQAKAVEGEVKTAIAKTAQEMQPGTADKAGKTTSTPIAQGTPPAGVAQKLDTSA